jgi:hypothetical protein
VRWGTLNSFHSCVLGVSRAGQPGLGSWEGQDVSLLHNEIWLLNVAAVTKDVKLLGNNKNEVVFSFLVRSGAVTRRAGSPLLVFRNTPRTREYIEQVNQNCKGMRLLGEDPYKCCN